MNYSKRINVRGICARSAAIHNNVFNLADTYRCARVERPRAVARFLPQRWGRLLPMLAIVLLSATITRGQSAATMNIQVNQPGAVVSSNLFGIFFEEINFAGDGGLYGEMVRNRTFYADTPAYWTFVTQGTANGSMTVDSTMSLNTNLPNSLKLTMASGLGSVGAANSGYWGMSVSNGAAYNLSFYAKSASGFSGPVVARLENAAGTAVYAQASFSGLTGNWQKFSASLTSSATDTNAQLIVSFSQSGTIWLDVVSLFPQATFNDRTNGLRADLANMLAALHPSFMRYPGGNFIEGANLTNAVRWKKTIGDISQRPGHMNDAWGYWSTDGFGLDEYLRFCEDLGMHPLYGINAGLALGYNGSANNTVPLSQMGPWVQDALDLIQYANGSTNTTWGALRAANGHPGPYDLQYLEIGNENGGSYYNDRYALFYDAIKSNYPDIHLITPNWGGIPTSRPVEIEDEHYYSSPAWFEQNATKYDSYNRAGPKVFVGEYAVTSGYGTYGNLAAALGEAAFMTGMERNSDIVLMASYAPLFANVNGTQWHPDLIYYNSSQVFGTPSYYVQKMFSNNRGDYVLPDSITNTTNTASIPAHGAIGVGSWNTAVQYTNITVVSNGVTLYQSDFVNQGTNGWRVFNGAWSANNGVYQQTAQIINCYSTYMNNASTNWANYTISLQARKTGGAEGFLILFNYLDDNNWTWWNIGGWGNTYDAIEQMANGAKTTYARVPQTLAANTWYYIRIVVNGDRAQCYLGTNALQAATNLVQDITVANNATSGLLASTTFNQSSGQVIIKAVNPYSSPMATTFNLAGVNSISPNATVIQLTSGSPLAENSFAAPTYVSPVTNSISNAGTNFTLTLPANSLYILRLTASGINDYTNLLLQVPSPITNGVTVAATVWGQQSGNWFNLTTNTRHAITWASADTNVAKVDIYGNVTGVGSGTANIVASYPALGLSATQAVQVMYVAAPPAPPVRLVHRYRFSDANGGTTVADSVGGPSWNGTVMSGGPGAIPTGGAFTNGVLWLNAAISNYVQLPSGILSNYAAVTIEGWVTEWSPMSSVRYSMYYAFGRTEPTDGLGYDYIFGSLPRVYTAITSGTYSSEQGTSEQDYALASGTPIHWVAVYDPPDGYIALYTNGVLQSMNTSVTDPMSVVSPAEAFIGRSLFLADPYASISLDEFRIYQGAMTPQQVAATQVLGPDQLLTTNAPMSAAVSSSNLTLSWPVAAAGFTLESRTNLAVGAWVPVTSPPPQIVGDQWQITLPISADTEFFRLGY